jgi:predicted enzyme related to lactoylglutathione lyase
MTSPLPRTQAGKSYWFDLPATNVLDAMSFYEGLFGWTFVRLSDPVLPNYWVIEHGGEWIGGLREMPKDNARKNECDAPVLYFTVEQLDPAVARAKELGAKLVGNRVELGKQRGVYQWIRDREENLVALWGPQ